MKNGTGKLIHFVQRQDAIRNYRNNMSKRIKNIQCENEKNIMSSTKHRQTKKNCGTMLLSGQV